MLKMHTPVLVLILSQTYQTFSYCPCLFIPLLVMASAIYQANGRWEGSMQSRGENKYAKNPESESKLLPSGRSCQTCLL